MSLSSPSLWTPLPQNHLSPCDRYKHACCSYGGHVYVLGGRESSGVGDFWKYSVGKRFLSQKVLNVCFLVCLALTHV